MISYTDDVSGTPVQSDTITIEATGNSITQAKWMFAPDCGGVDFSTANDFDTINQNDTTTTILIQDESQNGNLICSEVIDADGSVQSASSNSIIIDVTPPTLSLIGNNPETIYQNSSYTES